MKFDEIDLNIIHCAPLCYIFLQYEKYLKNLVNYQPNMIILKWFNLKFLHFFECCAFILEPKVYLLCDTTSYAHASTERTTETTWWSSGVSVMLSHGGLKLCVYPFEIIIHTPVSTFKKACSVCCIYKRRCSCTYFLKACAGCERFNQGTHIRRGVHNCTGLDECAPHPSN